MSLLKWETNTQRCKYSQSKLIQADTPRQSFALPPDGCRQWLGGNIVQVNGKKILNAEEPGALGSSSQPLDHWQDKRLDLSRVQAHRKAQVK